MYRFAVFMTASMLIAGAGFEAAAAGPNSCSASSRDDCRTSNISGPGASRATTALNAAPSEAMGGFVRDGSGQRRDHGAPAASGNRASRTDNGGKGNAGADDGTGAVEHGNAGGNRSGNGNGSGNGSGNSGATGGEGRNTNAVQRGDNRYDKAGNATDARGG